MAKTKSLVGQILCLKTTGEKVFVLSVPTLNGEILVRRAQVGTDGGYTHMTETFTTMEIETPQEHMAAQITEMIEKGEAQMELARAERALNKKMELEFAEDDKVIEMAPLAKKERPN